MIKDKKCYDMIISLGGNCSAAHNLRYRKLRAYSLPFDWLYIKDTRPIEYLSEGFKNGFSDFCKKENLQRLDLDEEKEVSHSDTIHYLDSYTKYRFVNHFHREIENSNEYEIVFKRIKRRIERLLNNLKRSKNVLFILSISEDIHVWDAIKSLSDALQEIYKNVKFEFVIIKFSTNSGIRKESNITEFSYARDINLYDFTHTNFEWEFLDNVKLKHTNKDEITLLSLSFRQLRYKLKLFKSYKD